ncbi:MAG: cell division protein FtsL [bacterium]|nr:cell division protein FtsL [bacterium]
MSDPYVDEEDVPQRPVKESPTLVRQRRLLNRWSIFALVFVSALATVLYVNNVITVNRLLRDSEAMRKSVDSLRDVNRSLQTEVFRLQSAERVTRIATERLGMTPPPQAPTVFTADGEEGAEHGRKRR